MALRPLKRVGRAPSGARNRIRAVCIRVLVSVSLTLGSAAAASPLQAASTGVFGYGAQAFHDLSVFPNWTGTLARYERSRATAVREGCFQKISYGQRLCEENIWRDILDRVRGAAPRKQLELVNRLLNMYPYRSDTRNGGGDDWQAPMEFLARGGDCEDYAVAKYLALRELGWDPSKMKIIVLLDMQKRIHHAVLAVEHEGRDLILDNQLAFVVEDGNIDHYRPIYAVNEQAWWRYMPGR